MVQKKFEKIMDNSIKGSGRVFVMAAEFLNITEKTGMVNLTVRFSVIKSW